ncbi:MAG: lipopolysaccharide kinase InaA family protein [Gemmataceae bacterium]|jgi:serine/threonine protein kinase|nr:lipopolysaccharide kinase InaA family protein [Gemmataceae bacterium]
MPRDFWIINSDESNRVQNMGLTSPEFVEQLRSVVVSGHIRRNVSRAYVCGHEIFIKREHEIRFSDRLKSFIDGQGFTSLAAREVNILNQLKNLSPTWLAWGERHGRSWLVLDSIGPCESFFDFFTNDKNHTSRSYVLSQIAQGLAQIHSLGIYQSDLFAKHIFILPDRSIQFLDWQRARLSNSISFSMRKLCFQKLYQSIPTNLILPDEWNLFVKCYRDRLGLKFDIESFLNELKMNSTPRTQLRYAVMPSVDQELMRFEGESLCAIPDYYSELLSILDHLYQPRTSPETLPIQGQQFTLESSTYPFSMSRFFNRIQRKVWRSPHLKTARLLLHLERYGCLTNKLIAYGQQLTCLGGRSFVLSKPVSPVQPIEFSDPQIVPKLNAALARLHEIGIILNRQSFPFYLSHGKIAYDYRALTLYRKLTNRHIRRDQEWLKSMIEHHRTSFASNFWNPFKVN